MNGAALVAVPFTRYITDDTAAAPCAVPTLSGSPPGSRAA